MTDVGVQMNSNRFFSNTECKYYPCKKTDRLNCLFCFCPLYPFENCGGNYSILKNGVKDCSKCLLPHSEKGYDIIIEFLKKNYGSNHEKQKRAG